MTPAPDGEAAAGTAPDGSPVEFYALVPAGDEPDIIDAAAPRRPSTVLELGCGAGRLLRPLGARGHRVTGVDESTEMLAACDGPGGEGIETVPARIETLDLGRTFDLVVLASHLVNTDDDRQRAAFLAAVRRHLAEDGVAVVQWHPPGWFDTLTEGRSERDGIAYHLHSLRRDGAYLHAVVDYRAGGRSWRHPFTARRLDEADLGAALAAAGLHFGRWLDGDGRWFTAGTGTAAGTATAADTGPGTGTGSGAGPAAGVSPATGPAR